MRRRSALALLLACASLAGCGGRHVPDGWASNAGDAMRDAYGSWIYLEYEPTVGGVRGAPQALAGELICIEPDSMFVQRPGQNGVIGLSLGEVYAAELARTEPSAGSVGGAAFVGTLATVSHGFYLIITAPIWIITGIFATTAEHGDDWLEWPDDDWGRFRLYARFPAGWPEGIDRATLAPKPYSGDPNPRRFGDPPRRQ